MTEHERLTLIEALIAVGIFTSRGTRPDHLIAHVGNTNWTLTRIPQQHVTGDPRRIWQGQSADKTTLPMDTEETADFLSWQHPDRRAADARLM
ncbi:hypothetical protein AB0H73_13050 [Streptomyces olivoreticuli]